MCPAQYIANLHIVPRIVPYSSYIIVCITIAMYVHSYIHSMCYVTRAYARLRRF